jgi:colicin import membrane protein
LVNESLRAAQAGWDAERAEVVILSKQMADAFEAQVVDLESAQAEIERRADELRKEGDRKDSYGNG